MQIEFAMLADAAAAPPDGKLYIHGGAFDTISSPQFPCAHPSLTLVIRLVGPRSEAHVSHEVMIRLRDGEGNEVIPSLNATVQPQQVVAMTPNVNYTVVLAINSLTFSRAGEHRFDIFIDGQHLKTVPLHLVQLLTAGVN